MKFALRLFALTLFAGALAFATSQTTGVKADAFTNVGCPTGNYTCLYSNGGQAPPAYYPGYGYGQTDPFAAVGCADNDLNCFYSRTGTGAGYAPYGAAPAYPGYPYSPYGPYNPYSPPTGISSGPAAPQPSGPPLTVVSS